ncbi:hypothetical protein VNI00_006057 [Paramarasmius palmivorus]|uniref:Uncharacterized protein n=1 Tax=Paramarasmius palmivorus TaxID=297713 RepID=A0AAW0DAU9_9AGAR
MAGTKRSAPDSSPTSGGRTTRSAKNPKVEKEKPVSKKGGAKKGGPKATLPASQFKAKALPLHINVTHTPPILPSDSTEDATTTTAHADPGFLGNLTLVPSTFNTGSYGWKGSKRITVELQNDDAEGGKEKVQVQLTFNATVLGSKGAGGEEDGDGDKEEAAEEKEEKADAE